MKKFMVAFVAFVMAMSVMVMGPEKALATTEVENASLEQTELVYGKDEFEDLIVRFYAAEYPEMEITVDYVNVIQIGKNVMTVIVASCDGESEVASDLMSIEDYNLGFELASSYVNELESSIA